MLPPFYRGNSDDHEAFRMVQSTVDTRGFDSVSELCTVILKDKRCANDLVIRLLLDETKRHPKEPATVYRLPFFCS